MPSLTNSPGTAPACAAPAGLPTADEAVAHTLLNCLLREVSGPEHQTAVDRRPAAAAAAAPRSAAAGRAAPYLAARRAPVHRPGVRADRRRLGRGRLAPAGRVRARRAVAADRGAQRGVPGADRLQPPGRLRRAGRPYGACPARPPRTRTGAEDWQAAYVASEQSLILGHRFHPTPKARTGDPVAWQSYAPETGAAFPLLLLAVREELIAEEASDRRCHRPAGRAAHRRPGRLPAAARPPLAVRAAARPRRSARGAGPRRHPRPGQRRHAVRRHRVRAHALRRRGVPQVQPERPDHQLPPQERQLRAVRRGGPHPAAGAGARRSRHPVPRQRGAPRARLPQPGAARRRRPPGHRAARRLRRHRPRGPVPAAAAGHHPAAGRRAVADEYPTSPAHVSRLLDGAGPQAALEWWAAYLNLLLPPVLAAYFDHGLVLEPHLQNVLVCVDGDGMPAQVLFRDLEGTKLVPEHHADAARLAARARSRAR